MGRIDSFIKAPPQKISAVLLYGPDGGLVRERAKVIGKSAVENLADPFRVTILTGKEIIEDPLRLSDEAGALSLIGGRRLVRVKEPTEGITRALAQALDVQSDTLFVIEAGDLATRSSLRRLIEEHNNAAALPCYADDGQTLRNVILQTLRHRGLRPDRDALEYLMSHLGSDRQITKSELEKVCLYNQVKDSSDQSQISLSDVQLIVGDTSAITIDDAIRATALGQPNAMEHALDRAISSGVSSIQILRAHLRHFQRLHLTVGHLAEGLTEDTAMNKLIPKVFFKEKDFFRQQLKLWPMAKIDHALKLMIDTEIQCKSTGMPDITLCRRALLRMAHAAQRSRI